MDEWLPINTAPTDGTPVLVKAPAKHGLPEIITECAYHPDAGFCVDELREVEFWKPISKSKIDWFFACVVLILLAALILFCFLNTCN
jgi:hypothetical protein